MQHNATLALSAAAILIASAAAAQNAPPTYQADPDTYKVIFDDANFRVIAATWKKGATDKPHAHPLPFVVYQLDDCTLRLHNPDGSTRDVNGKAGTAFAGQVTASHTAENVSATDCHAILVERK
jgi:hypothetical protein